MKIPSLHLAGDITLKDTSKYLEIAILVLASFSPLVPQPIKAIVVLSLVIVNYKCFFVISPKRLLVLWIFLSVFIVSMIVDLRNISSLSQFNILNIYLPLCVTLGYVIGEKYTKHEFYMVLDKVLFVFALFSLLGVLLYTFFPDNVKMLPSYSYYQTSHKTAILFNVIMSDENRILHRNAGIAWEPGAFQFLMNIGLYSYLKTRLNPNLGKIAVYSLAIITTKSTAGLLIFVVITLKLCIVDKRVRYLVLSTILLFAGTLFQEIKYQYEYKLFGSYSFRVRLEPLINSFVVGRKYLFGLGNSGFDNYFQNGTRPPWDSIGQIFIRYGYPLFVLIFARLLRFVNSQRVLLIILLITFASQNIWFFPIVTPFYFNFREDDNSLIINESSMNK